MCNKWKAKKQTQKGQADIKLGKNEIYIKLKVYFNSFVSYSPSPS